MRKKNIRKNKRTYTRKTTQQNTQNIQNNKKHWNKQRQLQKENGCTLSPNGISPRENCKKKKTPRSVIGVKEGCFSPTKPLEVTDPQKWPKKNLSGLLQFAVPISLCFWRLSMLTRFWHPCMVMFSNELDNPVSTQGVCSWWTASAAEPSYNGSVCMCEFWLLFTVGMSYYWVNDAGVPKTLVAFMATYCNDFPCNWRLPSQEAAYSTSQTHRPKSRVPQPPPFLRKTPSITCNGGAAAKRKVCGDFWQFWSSSGNFLAILAAFSDFWHAPSYLLQFWPCWAIFLNFFLSFSAIFGPYPSRALPVPFPYPSRTLLVPFSYPSRTLLVPLQKGTRRVRTKNRPKTGKIAQNRSSTTRIAKYRCKLFFLPQFTPKRRPNCPNTVFRPLRVRCAPLAATLSLFLCISRSHLFLPAKHIKWISFI